ncbi:TetR/AcrR family transcriptional regulator [Rhizobium skierniewicense]|uniref:TetR/AcrR family transcriptional regulator n=1 Tax=Rhizobium skierniewicense TaxID=984260 RepID=UPI001F21CFCA|nr:TetR/AcrR family transcriptional regulator [Rhizobium skierniewicense]
MTDKMNDGPVLDQAPPRRRKSPKGMARKEAILTTAMQHFARDGYQSASFAAIAADVGLSLPGLLHYFPTKVALLLAILEKRDLDSASSVGEDYLDWRKVLLGLVEIAAINQTIPNVVQAFAVLNAESLTADHPASAWFAARVMTLKTNLAFCLQKGIADGEIRPETDPEAITAELISMMDGLQMLWLRSPEEFDMVTVFSSYITRLIDTIRLR